MPYAQNKLVSKTFHLTSSCHIENFHFFTIRTQNLKNILYGFFQREFFDNGHCLVQLPKRLLQFVFYDNIQYPTNNVIWMCLNDPVKCISVDIYIYIYTYIGRFRLCDTTVRYYLRGSRGGKRFRFYWVLGIVCHFREKKVNIYIYIYFYTYDGKNNME